MFLPKDMTDDEATLAAEIASGVMASGSAVDDIQRQVMRHRAEEIAAETIWEARAQPSDSEMEDLEPTLWPGRSDVVGGVDVRRDRGVDRRPRREHGSAPSRGGRVSASGGGGEGEDGRAAARLTSERVVAENLTALDVLDANPDGP